MLAAGSLAVSLPKEGEIKSFLHLFQISVCHTCSNLFHAREALLSGLSIGNTKLSWTRWAQYETLGWHQNV